MNEVRITPREMIETPDLAFLVHAKIWAAGKTMEDVAYAHNDIKTGDRVFVFKEEK